MKSLTKYIVVFIFGALIGGWVIPDYRASTSLHTADINALKDNIAELHDLVALSNLKIDQALSKNTAKLNVEYDNLMPDEQTAVKDEVVAEYVDMNTDALFIAKQSVFEKLQYKKLPQLLNDSEITSLTADEQRALMNDIVTKVNTGEIDASTLFE